VTVAVDVSPYRMFPVRLARRERRSPSLVRMTFADPSLAKFADRGYDQRIKLVIPKHDGLPLRDFPTGDDWWTQWREQPEDVRAHIRTYTVVAVRPEQAEIDVDFVDHGITGPGSRFAVEAAAGDEAVIFGPNADFDGDAGGLEFRRELGGTAKQLIVGDITALPAINGILERLPAGATGLVCVEVPHEADAQGVVTPPNIDLVWSVADRGDDQCDAVRRWLTGLGPLATDHAATTVIDDGALDAYWEVSAEDPAATATADLSAWIAGESGQVRALRRMLVDEFDIPKAAVCFMGYWRIGVAGS
jgi:NADPH-dependent ferric siderophore reductase